MVVDTVAFVEDFDGDDLDPSRWLPAHLPQWSSRSQAAARYQVADGRLILRIDEDQPPWCPEFDGTTKVSSLQTGVFSGPVGSGIGQHRFRPEVVVREAQEPLRLYTPRYASVEVRARAKLDPHTMVAFWMIGFEDAPDRSGEICVFEIFGHDVEPGRARVGMGIHPFGDPHLVDDFEQVPLDIDVTEFHAYALDWTPTHCEFLVDGRPVRTVHQSPDYPMQFMLGIYEFPEPGADPGVHPKEFEVDHVRARPVPEVDG